MLTFLNLPPRRARQNGTGRINDCWPDCPLPLPVKLAEIIPDKLYAALDRSGKDRVTMADFVRFVGALGMGEEDAWEAFYNADVDKNDYLTAPELSVCLATWGADPSVFGPCPSFLTLSTDSLGKMNGR